jgi:hypothetical protein
MDRHDRVTGRDQRVDDEAGRPLDGDRYLRCRRQPGQARDQLANPLGVVPHRKARNNAAGLVKDADSMGGTAPIHSRVVGHISGPPRCDRLARAGRSCGSLIDRRGYPWRDTLWSVRTSRRPPRGGSHAGRRPASDTGRHGERSGG